jgi:hypothetical protein
MCTFDATCPLHFCIHTSLVELHATYLETDEDSDCPWYRHAVSAGCTLLHDVSAGTSLALSPPARPCVPRYPNPDPDAMDWEPTDPRMTDPRMTNPKKTSPTNRDYWNSECYIGSGYGAGRANVVQANVVDATLSPARQLAFHPGSGSFPKAEDPPPVSHTSKISPHSSASSETVAGLRGCLACAAWTQFVTDLYKSFTLMQTNSRFLERIQRGGRQDITRNKMVMEALIREGFVSLAEAGEMANPLRAASSKKRKKAPAGYGCERRCRPRTTDHRSIWSC